MIFIQFEMKFYFKHFTLIKDIKINPKDFETLAHHLNQLIKGITYEKLTI